MLAEHQLAQISGLIVQAGKSPATGAEGLVAAAEALRWLQEAVDAGPKQQAVDAGAKQDEAPKA
jgi:hypothetical protein